MPQFRFGHQPGLLQNIEMVPDCNSGNRLRVLALKQIDNFVNRGLTAFLEDI